MIGQKKIIEKLDSMTAKDLPHTNLFVGAKGSGRKTIVNIISNRFHLNIIDMTNNLTHEAITNTYLNPFSCIYLIDADVILSSNKVERDENAILKFLEEPPSSAYIFLICANPTSLLTTITNRCQVWKFEPYSESELRRFTSDEMVLKIASTPGQIIELQEYPIQEMFTLSKDILSKLGNASYSKTLMLSNKISFATDVQEKNKYPVKIFMRVFLEAAKDFYLTNPDLAFSYDTYMTTLESYKDMQVPHADQDYLFDRFLIHLRSVIGRGNTNENKVS